MDATDEVGAEGRMDRAVAGKAAHRAEFGGAHSHEKVGLAALAPAAMAAMLLAFVNHLKRFRTEALLQPITNFVSYRHFVPSPLLSRAITRKLSPPSRKGQ